MAKLKAKSDKSLDAALIDKLAKEAEAGYDLAKAKPRRVGRPSLRDGISPRLQFRVAPDLYEEARNRARKEGRPLSDLAREALQRYVERPGA